MKSSDTALVQKNLKVLEMNAAATAAKVNSYQITITYNADANGRGGDQHVLTITSAQSAAWNQLNTLLNNWLSTAVPASRTALSSVGVASDA